MPTNLQGQDIGGAVGLTWDMTGVEFEDGCSIEAKPVVNGAQFGEMGQTGPNENTFQFDSGGFSDWLCRIRSFNASGYSEYTEPIEVTLN